MLPSSSMLFFLPHVKVSNSQPLFYESANLTISPLHHHRSAGIVEMMKRLAIMSK